MWRNRLRKSMLRAVPFETERLIIRDIRMCDALDMNEYASDPEVSKYLLWNPHTSLSVTEGYIESVVQRYLRGLYGDWAIILKENGKMIGTVGYAMIDTHAEHCEIGYVLSPYFRKKGYMTEAVNAVLDLTFRDFGFRTAELRIMDENADSVKLAERVGFELGRTVPDEIEVKGLPRTLRHYYMTDKRYREIRGI